MPQHRKRMLNHGTRIRKARKRNRKIESDEIHRVRPAVTVVTQVSLAVVQILIAVNQHLVQVRKSFYIL